MTNAARWIQDESDNIETEDEGILLYRGDLGYWLENTGYAMINSIGEMSAKRLERFKKRYEHVKSINDPFHKLQWIAEFPYIITR